MRPRRDALDLSGQSFYKLCESAPFFDTCINRRQFTSTAVPTPQPRPESRNLGFVPDHHQALEPSHPSASFSRFIAGTYKVGKDQDLNAPLNDTIS